MDLNISRCKIGTWKKGAEAMLITI